MTKSMLIDINIIQALVARLGAATQEASRIHATLEDQVAALRGQWSGDASDAFESAHGEWTKRLDAATALLARASEHVSSAAEAFADVEKANAARW
ncbi:WXG100 family type VII secretion target [Leifsonia sp. ZF2019]|uniref:WXG100 family type VII secretion target n=1 Tax=Leifsonia sp. ZF2019 TaxID=2781978 RepID=UPI001CC109B3|nr:WXG100 family type VII secretion target [Leifsonia sp. ZF2019]UAJ78771.1 WXG100 family type VII secretion target [Leifsonia sp. ZF2019]